MSSSGKCEAREAGNRKNKKWSRQQQAKHWWEQKGVFSLFLNSHGFYGFHLRCCEGGRKVRSINNPCGLVSWGLKGVEGNAWRHFWFPSPGTKTFNDNFLFVCVVAINRPLGVTSLWQGLISSGRWLTAQEDTYFVVLSFLISCLFFYYTCSFTLCLFIFLLFCSSFFRLFFSVASILILIFSFVYFFAFLFIPYEWMYHFMPIERQTICTRQHSKTKLK